MTNRVAGFFGCLLIASALSVPGALARQAGSNAGLVNMCVKGNDAGAKIENCSRLISGTSDRRLLEKALNSRAKAYHERGLYNEALGDFNRLIGINPTVAGYYDNRMYTLKALGRLADALSDANMAVSLAPGHAFVYNSRASVLEDMGRLREAISDYSKSIAISPTYAFRYYARGNAHFKLGDFNEAIEDFTRAFDLEKGWTVAIRDRGRAYKALGLLDKAKEDLEWFIRAEPSDEIGTAALNEVRAALQAIAPPTMTSRTNPGPADPVPSIGQTHEKRVALVVGNAAYRLAPALANPGNDARDVARTLRRLGFDVTEGIDLDYQGMRAAIRSFSEALEGADLAVFFYAGHAMQVAGHNYLVPVDAKLEKTSDLDLDAVDLQAVLNAMEAEKRVSIIVLDACRNNPFTRSLKRSLGTSRSAAVREGLAPVDAAAGTLIAFATQPGNVALDGTGTRNSPFTESLLKHVSTPGLEVEQMFKRVRADVVSSTKGRQTPWSNSSLIGEVFLTAPQR